MVIETKLVVAQVNGVVDGGRWLLDWRFVGRWLLVVVVGKVAVDELVLGGCCW